MAAVIDYIKESYVELTEKVTWPTWSELRSSAVLVIIASLIIALIIFGMDYVINTALQYLYKSLV